MSICETLILDSWEGSISEQDRQKAIKALEGGRIVYLPKLSFALTANERSFLTPGIADPKSKNISYDSRNQKLGGAQCETNVQNELQEMMHRYATASRTLMDHLFPDYSAHLIQARTSFRPTEIAGRKSSYRKDDTRLHVDAFPSSPVKGERILRVFTNVNPHGKPRVWRVGESFDDVVKRMGPELRKPFPGIAQLLNLLKITKSQRTLYDHYMLSLHDKMKGNIEYQKKVPQQELQFPPGCTWIVFSDQVSHAAMSGQYLFEQTFHLPVRGLQDENSAPLRVLERYFQQQLV